MVRVSKLNRSLVLVLTLVAGAMLLVACEQMSDRDVVREGRDSVAATLEHNKIYLDSVPPKAIVICEEDGTPQTVDRIPEEEDEGGLGLTPLVIDAQRCPSKKFGFLFVLPIYLEQLEEHVRNQQPVQALKRLSESDSLARQLQEVVNFDTGTTTVMTTAENIVVMFGPNYELQWPAANRLVAWAIPKGLTARDLFPLMGADDSFDFAVEGIEQVGREFNVDAEKMPEMIESLRRSGKFFGIFKQPGGGSARLSVTMQGKPSKLYVTESVRTRD